MDTALAEKFGKLQITQEWPPFFLSVSLPWKPYVTYEEYSMSILGMHTEMICDPKPTPTYTPHSHIPRACSVLASGERPSGHTTHTADPKVYLPVWPGR